MVGHPDKRQFEMLDQPQEHRTYEVSELAKRYGLSHGQALTLITIHGPSRVKLDAIMAEQPYL